MTKPPPEGMPVVRSERESDRDAVSTLVRSAYAAVPYSDHREHRMVEALRDSPSFVPELSLVAEGVEALAGHLLLTQITVAGRAISTRGLSLAPLSVAPEQQGLGVGSKLVREAHKRAERLGFDYVVLVGPPDYYRRFGYKPLIQYPINLPFSAPAANCMIRRLRQTGLTGVEGMVRFDPVWLQH